MYFETDINCHLFVNNIDLITVIVVYFDNEIKKDGMPVLEYEEEPPAPVARDITKLEVLD